jgi:aldose 1-epimerase
VHDHQLWLAADRYTLADDQLIPTGEIASVKGTPLDFTVPTAIGARIDQLKPKLNGYDHNFVLPSDATTPLLAARVLEPKSGRVLEMRTTQPGVQLYTANHLNGKQAGIGGVFYPNHGGFCLETQHYPDSVNHPSFPSTILRPGQTFQSTTVFALSAK